MSEFTVIRYEALTIFLSSFLLFLVQPLLAKAILPFFGGSPSVWTTCILFFQIFLVLGYAYASWLVKIRSFRYQCFIHLALLFLAFFSLPILPLEFWLVGNNVDYAVLRILLLLFLSVGLPYFLLSATSPLLQAWLWMENPSEPPYRLYSISNFGSLLALLSYPFLFERLFTVHVQGWFWSGAFAIFAILNFFVILRLLANIKDKSLKTQASDEDRIFNDDSFKLARIKRQSLSFLLPMLSTILFLSLSNRICLDLASKPLMWILPLAIYLLTFMLCFSGGNFYYRGITAFFTFILTGIIFVFFQANECMGAISTFLPGISNINPFRFIHCLKNELNGFFLILAPQWMLKTTQHFLFEVVFYLLWLFGACMLCHGELFRMRPREKNGLTSYYLLISIGGAFGGVGIVIVAPLIFSSYREWNLSIAGIAIISAGLFWKQIRDRLYIESVMFSRAVFGLIFAFVLLIVIGQIYSDRLFFYSDHILAQKRNFFGYFTLVNHNSEEMEKATLALYHGHILHGLQALSPELRCVPTSYYGRASGVSLAIEKMRILRRGKALRVGIIGLGVGTIAAFAEEGDYFRFYEIDPDIIALHQDKKFTYLSDSLAKVDVVAGDGRILLEREMSQDFDIIFLDAFSGGAPPIHLLTLEAFQIYLRHLLKDGVIVCNVSNRHIDLLAVMTALAQNFKMELIHVKSKRMPGEYFSSYSEWVLISSNKDFIYEPTIVEHRIENAEKIKSILWTDQYSSILSVIKW